MENDSNSKLKKWLDNLEQESWQLELLVSGFSIFLLIGIYEPIQHFKLVIAHWALANDFIQILVLPVFLLQGTWFALLVNLVIHVVLRGLWISTVGLRSVSGDIDFDKLNLASRYDRFLRKRCGSFDRYIDRLEQICSIIFAFTFLLVFALLAIGSYLFFTLGITAALSWGLSPLGHIGKVIPAIVNTLSFFFGLIYLIDFLSLGWLKRRKKIQRIYYPIYRMMGFFTLAFLYRPLYYNLIDNRLGKRAAWLIVPYIFLSMLGASAQFIIYTYYPASDAETVLQTTFYDDLWSADHFSEEASIPAKYVEHDYLEVFIPYVPDGDDKAVEHLCPELEVGHYTGLRISGIIRINEIENTKSDPAALLRCMSDIYRLYLNDSLLLQPDFSFYEHPQREMKGMLSVLDITDLDRGKHDLRVSRMKVATQEGKDSVYWKRENLIPFWK